MEFGGAHRQADPLASHGDQMGRRRAAAVQVQVSGPGVQVQRDGFDAGQVEQAIAERLGIHAVERLADQT